MLREYRDGRNSMLLRHAYGEMSGTKVVKVTFFFVSEIPSHDFCCAYLERHNMIFFFFL